MVGLSASELQAETLFPGDTIEYFSMAFVAGDPRGHRVSKVLRIDRKDDEFPVDVDTQEMLPLTIMLKRKRDRNDVEILSSDAKWRKLRTFRLVDGEVEGETRADRLNAELKKGLSDAIKSTKKRVAKEKEEKANAGSKRILSSYFTKLDHATDEGETTSSQRSSLEKMSTPERKKKRKPLTPRDSTEHHSSRQSHDKSVLKKSYNGGKTSRKSRPEEDTSRSATKFKYKHESRKRKRNDSTPTRPKQAVTPPRATQKTLSKFFGADQQRRSKTRTSIDLNKFMNHAKETDDSKEIKKIVQKKNQTLDINEHLPLDKKEQFSKTILNTGSADGDSSKGANHSDNAIKKTWSQLRSKYRESNAASGALRSWLKPLGNSLEETSRGTPTKPQQSKQRTLNLAGDRQKSPRMDRKNLSFLISKSSGDAYYQTKETKPSNDIPLKQDNLLRNKRGSLGTVSARVR
ncbi:hypothetical protein PHPALM_30414 [Phytophthora palmivora]|uniref:Uncharacterized protein n=1 Tax=Phytophthora palmivora TaxID=4796 RepID=A0A2P4X5A6_9STRA|nr:hypothetical protein PHPALM_30414 [Phytophthora palmivora]